MRELGRKLGDMEYDGLITDLTPKPQVRGGTIAKLTTATLYKRGTLLAKSSIIGKLVILGTEAAPAKEAAEGQPAVPAETLIPDCILCDDTEVGTTEDVKVATYTAGCFDPGKVTTAKDYTITEGDKDNLRMRNIVFKAAAPAT